MTHPGVGPVTGLAFVLTIGDPARFACGKQVASYLGLIPAENSSGGKQRLGHISKQGNARLRGWLVEAAHSAAQREPELGRCYRRLAMKKNRSIAAVAVARKLAIRLWWMWRRGLDYEPFRASGSHAGQASRWGEVNPRLIEWAPCLPGGQGSLNHESLRPPRTIVAEKERINYGKLFNGKCANCILSQQRGSPQHPVPDFVPSGGLLLFGSLYPLTFAFPLPQRVCFCRCSCSCSCFCAADEGTPTPSAKSLIFSFVANLGSGGSNRGGSSLPFRTMIFTNRVIGNSAMGKKRTSLG